MPIYYYYLLLLLIIKMPHPLCVSTLLPYANKIKQLLYGAVLPHINEKLPF